MWYATCVLFQPPKLLKRVTKKGTGFPMTAITPPVIRCPVCRAHGAVLRHDIRAPLVYSCQNCMHEWEIDLAEEPPQADPTAAERRQTPSARRKMPRKP